MNKFILVDQAMRIFENSSGCMMLRDHTSGKCKFLPLGRYKGTLTQEDLPCNFFSLSDHLDMLYFYSQKWSHRSYKFLRYKCFEEEII